MACLAPIVTRLIRPSWTDRVPAPAHDSLSATARRRFVSDNPDSYLTVTRSPDDLPDGRVWDPERALLGSRRSLARLLDLDAFSSPSDPALHLYRLALNGHEQVGIIGGVAVDDYDDGTIRIHEQINDERAEHLAAHLEALAVQSSPIALAHRPNRRIRTLIDDTMAATAPTVSFTAEDGLEQQVWTIGDPAAVEAIQAELADEPLYLIDGHHRAAAASRLRARSATDDNALMLCALFSARDLRNEAFHRILHGVAPDRLLDLVGDRFPVRRAVDLDTVLDRGPDDIALRTGGHWSLVTLPEPPDADTDPIAGLEPVRLQRSVLGPLFDIDPSSPSGVLTHRPGIADRADLESLAADDEGTTAAWVMRPVLVDVLIKASDDGRVMPPKSTYFVPKVRSGVFLRSLD